MRRHVGVCFVGSIVPCRGFAGGATIDDCRCPAQEAAHEHDQAHGGLE